MLPFRSAIIVGLLGVSRCAGQLPSQNASNAFSGTWLTAWYPGYVEPQVCVKVWRATDGRLLGTRHRAGNDAICSLLEGLVSEQGRVWTGTETYWNASGDKTSGAKVDFRLIVSSNGATFSGVREVPGSNPAAIPWWGVRASCAVNPEAERKCDYPQ